MNDKDYTGSTSLRDLFALCWKLEGCDIHWLPYDIRTRKFDGICVSDLGRYLWLFLILTLLDICGMMTNTNG